MFLFLLNKKKPSLFAQNNNDSIVKQSWERLCPQHGVQETLNPRMIPDHRFIFFPLASLQLSEIYSSEEDKKKKNQPK